MRTYFLFLIAMGFFSNWVLADVYKEPQTGTGWPESLGGFKRGEVTRYEAEPGQAGVAIEYGSDDAAVTGYVRGTAMPPRRARIF